MAAGGVFYPNKYSVRLANFIRAQVRKMTTPKDTALSATWQMMEPIIGILLRNGVTHKEFSLLCKQLYVKIASEEFGIRGRPTNLSRVAMMTGLDRKEVSRIKENSMQDNTAKISEQHQDRLNRILSGWYQDKDFIDVQGHPKLISIDEDDICFNLLVRRYGGDLPASALLKELKRVGIVEEIQGKLRVLGRYFVVDPTDAAALLRAGNVIQDIANALEHNLYKSNSQKNQPKRFERRASNSQMPMQSLAEFRAFVETEGQAFLERVDAWLTEHETYSNVQDANDQNSTQVKMRLGVGAYLIESRIEPTLDSGDEK
jgi:hypothetical protein